MVVKHIHKDHVEKDKMLMILASLKYVLSQPVLSCLVLWLVYLGWHGGEAHPQGSSREIWQDADDLILGCLKVFLSQPVLSCLMVGVPRDDIVVSHIHKDHLEK